MRRGTVLVSIPVIVAALLAPREARACSVSSLYINGCSADIPTSEQTPLPADAGYPKRCVDDAGSCMPAAGAPSVPVVSFEIVLVKDGQSGGAFGCPDEDQVVVHLQVASADATYALFFFGDTEAAADAATAPEASTFVCSPDATSTYTVTANAGDAEHRQRPDLGGFTRSGRYCFEAAMMNGSGVVGPRSAAQCLNTQDESDPHVTFVGAESRVGCLCEEGPANANAPAAILACLAAIALGSRRRTRA